jgi:hypothetical protein
MGIKSYFYSRPADSDPLTRVEHQANDESHIVPSEVFYIGSTGSLSARIANHKRDVSKARGILPPEGTAVTLRLCEAEIQGAPVDVYVRPVPTDFAVRGLPVDLLRGWEAGLIRELKPTANGGGSASSPLASPFLSFRNVQSPEDPLCDLHLPAGQLAAVGPVPGDGPVEVRELRPPGQGIAAAGLQSALLQLGRDP